MKFGSCPRIQHGFTYIALLIAVAVSGAALASIGELASRSAQREKEKELLFAGGEMRRAIGEFYERAPGGAKRYPKSLEELLEDRRQPVPQRYLRRIYPDPFSGKPEWGLVEAPEGGVMGVYSRSPLEPIRTGRFPPEYEAFEKAKSYADWQFVYAPPAPPAQPTPK